MKNIFISFLVLFSFMISCKGQDKDLKKQAKVTYHAKCQGEYSIREKLSKKNKKWSLTKADIDKIISLSSLITENEWHFTYSITPCDIDVKDYLYKGKRYDLQINGGSYISLYDGGDTLLLGCDSPECNKYFLKSKENMQEEEVIYSPNDSTKSSEQIRKYNVSFSKKYKQDLLIVKKKANGYSLEAKTDDNIFFSKEFTCDFIEIETSTKNKQTFNLVLGYTDQYQNIFRKIVIPVFFRNDDLFIEKVFISSLGDSAKTGKEEWIRKEVSEKNYLKQLDLDKILSN